MDLLTQFADLARARSASFCLSEFVAPWALRIEDQAPLGLVTPLQGQVWVSVPGVPPVLCEVGEVALVAPSGPFTVGDDPTTVPDLFAGPAGQVTTATGIDITDELKSTTHTSTIGPALFSREYLSATTRSAPAQATRRHTTILASGTYAVAGDVSGRLMGVLPPLVRIPAHEGTAPIIALLADQIKRDQPGQQVVLDRILDLALIACLNVWFAGEGSKRPGWHRAHADPVVAVAIQAIHDDPATPWTVASLAAYAGCSRAGFARRFAEVVGASPIAYLTQHRIDLAADLLRDPGMTLDAVARRVGYAGPSALSVAFKRLRSHAPRTQSA